MRTPQIIASILLAVLASSASSAATGDGRRDWIEGLKQPRTGNSCCDISDCRKTLAEWRRDGWWAMVYGRWTPVPPETLLNGECSYDGDAYVCASWSAGVLCFVPPSMPM